MNNYIPPVVVDELVKFNALEKFGAAFNCLSWSVVFGLFVGTLLVAPGIVVYVLLKHLLVP